MTEGVQKKKVSPSEFMRQLRPALYSDTSDRTTYLLDATTLEYSLDTITARNQTHDFELFCRKLCCMFPNNLRFHGSSVKHLEASG